MKTSTKRDFRSLSEETQAELRRLAFRKIDQGLTQGKVAEIVEVCNETISRWETSKKVWLQTVSKYTYRWGLTPQRPAKYAHEQDPEKIRKWLNLEYPKIAEEAKKYDAEIHWEDETGVALSTFYARSYAPKGHTPAVKLPARQGHISLISSITNRGDLRFMMYRGALNTDLFLLFVERLIKDTSKKIYLIVDNLRVHKARKVQAWQQKNTDRIKIFFPASLRAATQS